MTCDLTSFSAVFQSYQEGGRMIMKGCVQCIPFMTEKISVFLLRGLISGQLVWQASSQPTERSGLKPYCTQKGQNCIQFWPF